MMKNFNYSLLLLPTLFCIVSFILFYQLPLKNHIDIDSAEYLTVAKEYQETGNLVNPDYPTQMPSHTIGYHWFLGIIFSLFNRNLSLIFLLQTILCLFCCFMLYQLSLRVFNASVGLVVLVLFSCNIGFLIYSQIILAEILLVTFLIGFLYFFCSFIHEKQTINLVFAGLLLGSSVIIKPVALLYILPLTLLLFLATPKSLLQRIILCLVLMSSFYLPIIGYMFYNKRTFNAFCITNLVNENIFIYFLPRRILPQMSSDYRKKSLQALEACITIQEKQQLSKKIFFEVARTYPAIICSAWLNAMLRTLCGLYSTQLKSMFNTSIQGGSCSFFNMHGTYWERIHSYICFGSTSICLTAIAYLEALWLVLQYFLVFIGLLYLAIRKKYFLFLFFSSYIGYFTFVTGHDGCARYRLMLEPILLLLVAIALTKIFQSIKITKQFKMIMLKDPVTQESIL